MEMVQSFTAPKLNWGITDSPTKKEVRSKKGVRSKKETNFGVIKSFMLCLD